MNAIMICLVAATLGSDVGWERLPDGGMEYVIQLDPETLDALRSGSSFQSTLHPDAGDDVRSYRIILGNGKLRRDMPLARSAKKTNTDTIEGPELLPRQLSPDKAKKPMPGQAAVFEEPAAKPAIATKSASAEPSKPWLPLTFTLFGLFASIGANIYLGWIAWESRRRCRQTPAMQDLLLDSQSE
jgi:hypothetical protein